MEDRKGKKEEAFTFGGQLTIENQDEQVDCILVSAAPIMQITRATPLHLRFIEEVEFILEKSQTIYSNHQEYEEHLTKTDPLVLYLACLDELLKKYKHFRIKIEKNNDFLEYLHSQKLKLEAAGLTRNPIPGIDDIFDK